LHRFEIHNPATAGGRDGEGTVRQGAFVRSLEGLRHGDARDVPPGWPSACAPHGSRGAASRCDTYFVTSIDSPKIEEIEENPSVTLTFQSATQFASLSGRVQVVRDRALIERFWKAAWKAWFPQGRDDPTITLLKFDAERGEYWDDSGLHGLKYLFDVATAMAAGASPTVDRRQNSKVSL
jgi:general stress protein 26